MILICGGENDCVNFGESSLAAALDGVAQVCGDCLVGAVVAAVGADFADRLVSLVDADADEKSAGAAVCVDDVDLGDLWSASESLHSFRVFSGNLDSGVVADSLDFGALTHVWLSLGWFWRGHHDPARTVFPCRVVWLI